MISSPVLTDAIPRVGWIQLASATSYFRVEQRNEMVEPVLEYPDAAGMFAGFQA
jgi:hypothetical protein